MVNNDLYFHLLNEHQAILNKQIFILNCSVFTEKEDRVFEHEGFEIRLYHKNGDPNGVNRLLIFHGDFKVELLPSKGLSVGEAYFRNRAIFWDPPLEKLPDPEKVDLKAPILINGENKEGYRFIETFTGGIEMLGLSNWGTPLHDVGSKKLLTLHGEVSNIPVKKVEIQISKVGIEIIGTFLVYDGESEKKKSWYERGKIVYRVTKRVFIEKELPRITVRDQVTNLTNEMSAPDWGYHIQLRPEVGAEYLVPSLFIQNRAEGQIDDKHEMWQPAIKSQVREETGIIHKGLKIIHRLLGEDDWVKTLLKYPDGSGTMVVVPSVPYFLSWFSTGGKNGEEFMLPGQNNGARAKIMKKNWDGVGPEFGVSALDHDGNIDQDIEEKKPLKPGETLEIKIILEVLNPKEVNKLEEEIKIFNKRRIIESKH